MPHGQSLLPTPRCRKSGCVASSQRGDSARSLAGLGSAGAGGSGSAALGHYTRDEVLEYVATIRAKTDQHWNNLPLLLRRTHDDDIDFTRVRPLQGDDDVAMRYRIIWLSRPYAVPAMVTPQWQW